MNPAAAILNQITRDISNNLGMNIRPNNNQQTRINNIDHTNSDVGVNNVEATPTMEGFTFNQILDNFIRGMSDEEMDEEITMAIAMAAQSYDLDPNLIRAVIQTESSFRPDAVSSAGAMGLMQLMPATAESLGVTDPFDISQNINGGARYLRRQLDRFDGDLDLALAAYNAGAGNVERFGGIPPFQETQNYVPRVLNHKQNFILEQYRNNNANR